MYGVLQLTQDCQLLILCGPGLYSSSLLPLIVCRIGNHHQLASNFPQNIYLSLCGVAKYYQCWFNRSKLQLRILSYPQVAHTLSEESLHLSPWLSCAKTNFKHTCMRQTTEYFSCCHIKAVQRSKKTQADSCNHVRSQETEHLFRTEKLLFLLYWY